MKNRKILLIPVLLVIVMGNACSVTDIRGNVVEEQTAGIPENLDEVLSEDAQLTLESMAQTPLAESLETQVAFADLSAEAVQETVNAALGMDIEEVREKFLIPENAIYITTLGDMVNFQMMQPMSEVTDYYQIQFSRQGLVLEDELSASTAMMTTLVYSGHDSGQLMQIQLVALNEGQTSVTIKYEE